MTLDQNGSRPPANGRQPPDQPSLAGPRAVAPPPPPDAGDVDLPALAAEVYRLLLREAALERERLGRPGPPP